MAGRVLVTPRYRRLTLTDGSWTVSPVLLASTFPERLIGIHTGHAEAILLHSRSVHGSGLAEPLRIVHLTRGGTVAGDELLAVGGRVSARSYWILEVSQARSSPPEGSVLRVLPSFPG